MSNKETVKSLQDLGKAMGRPDPNRCSCGKPKNPDFPTCRDCSQKQKGAQQGASGSGGGSSRSGASPAFAKLPENYLNDGYFEDRHLRDDLITTNALKCAETFEAIGLTSGQLRRFYAHARQVGRRLELGEPFPAVRPAILELCPLVADAVGRADRNRVGDYSEFKRFIDRNVKLAVTDKDHFQKGFLPHFQYVLAYFTFLKPKG